MKLLKSIYFSIIITFIFIQVGYSQEKNDKGNINLHMGALTVYSTVSIGYESMDFISNQAKHHLQINFRMGLWQSSFISKNKGLQFNAGFTYLYGAKNHHFELGSEGVFHFDKSLKNENKITYIATLYRPFIGYRYQPLDKKIIIRAGLGWKELIQLGIGWRI